MNTQARVVATIVVGLVVWVGLALGIRPQQPTPALQVTDDTETWLTRAQLNEAVTLSIPNLSSKAITVTAIALPDFEIEPSGPISVPSSAPPHEITLRSKAGARLAPSEYDAAVILIDNESQAVTVKITHAPWVPVLVILFGFGLSYSVSRWAGVRPGRELARRAAILLAHIRQHDEEVGSDIADTYRKYSIVDSAQRMVGFEKMIQDGSHSGSAASPGSDYREKSIVELILAGDLEKAEETYSRLRDFFETHRGFVAQLGKLQSTYEAVKEDVPGDERPEVEIRAEGFLIIGGDGNTITPVEDASHLSALVSEATELSTLYALLIRVHKRSGLGAAILSHLAPDQNWTEEDRSSFHAARADLFGARGDLWAARTLSETDIQNVEKQTESALVALRRLADRHPPRTLPTTRFALQSYAFDLLDTSTIDGVSEIMGWADHLLSKLVQSFRLLPIDDSDLTTEDLQDAARKSRRLTLLVDWLILALGWVVAAITATVALYVQKAFGSSLLDYVYALLWGVGVERSLTGLNSVLKMLGMGSEA